MKKILCLAIVLLSAISFFAQEKTIEKSEFDAALKNRFRKFARQAYRRTTSSENILTETDKNKMVSKSVMESAPRMGIRSVYQFDSPSIKKRRETIMIDGKTYVREDNGEWAEKTADEKTDGGMTPDRRYEVVEEQTEYKSLGTEILNDLKASVYAKIERKKRVYEPEKKEMFSTVATKYWLDEDGGIIKEEALSENVIKSERNQTGSIFRNLTTTTWEFDPNIKIEAPTIAKRF